MNQTFQMPDFIEIQRTNFFYLLEKGISSELQRIGPIESKEGEFEGMSAIFRSQALHIVARYVTRPPPSPTPRAVFQPSGQI